MRHFWISIIILLLGGIASADPGGTAATNASHVPQTSQATKPHDWRLVQRATCGGIGRHNIRGWFGMGLAGSTLRHRASSLQRPSEGPPPHTQPRTREIQWIRRFAFTLRGQPD